MVQMSVSWIYMTFFYKGDYRKVQAEKEARDIAERGTEAELDEHIEHEEKKEFVDTIIFK